MGVLPLAFPAGQTAETLGLNGREVIDISGISRGVVPGGELTVTATDPDTKNATTFPVIVRLNSPVEVEYLEHGGILQRVLRMFAKAK
jgi:aconitate hydratase